MTTTYKQRYKESQDENIYLKEIIKSLRKENKGLKAIKDAVDSSSNKIKEIFENQEIMDKSNFHLVVPCKYKWFSGDPSYVGSKNDDLCHILDEVKKTVKQGFINHKTYINGEYAVIHGFEQEVDGHEQQEVKL